MVFDRVSDALESYAERTAPTSVRRRRNRRFEAQTPCPRRNTRRRERARAKREAPNHSPAMSRGDFENHFGGHQAMRRREAGDSDASASRFVRTVAAAQSPVTLSSCSLMGVDNAGSGDWVWQWVRFAKNEESLKAHLRMAISLYLLYM
jgi:hypothetical protein